MTAIEFFDRTPIENIVSALTIAPKKIIFIGDKSLMEKSKEKYKKFIAKRKLEIELDFQPIIKNQLNNIVEVLSRIVETEDECVFDLTGGEELVFVAIGIVSQKYKDKNIQLQRFNVNNGRVTDCDYDGQVIYTGDPEITVEECINLHGGFIRYEKNDDDRTYKWETDGDFVNDVKNLWEECRKDPGRWNTRLNVLSSVDELYKPKGLETSYHVPTLVDFMKRNNDKYISLGGFLKYLEKNKYIFNLTEDGENISFRYKNDQIKRCLTQAGTILELRVLVSAREVVDKKSKRPCYNDSMSGVYIDWDGQFHERGEAEKDTENEIDVILMKGITPLFISCKNGKVDDDELYKLEAVTNRFGGEFAKKYLIATYLNKKKDSMEYFKQRAEDMNIVLVDNVHTLEPTAFDKVIRNLINLQAKNS